MKGGQPNPSAGNEQPLPSDPPAVNPAPPSSSWSFLSLFSGKPDDKSTTNTKSSSWPFLSFLSGKPDDKSASNTSFTWESIVGNTKQVNPNTQEKGTQEKATTNIAEMGKGGRSTKKNYFHRVNKKRAKSIKKI